MMPFRLVHTQIPPEMSQAAMRISQGVDAGEYSGLAVVVMMKGGKFFVDAFGTMVRDPHSSRGFVAALDDCLREKAHR